MSGLQIELFGPHRQRIAIRQAQKSLDSLLYRCMGSGPLLTKRSKWQTWVPDNKKAQADDVNYTWAFKCSLSHIWFPFLEPLLSSIERKEQGKISRDIWAYTDGMPPFGMEPNAGLVFTELG